MKKTLALITGGAIAGAVLTFLLMSLAGYRGCSIDFGLSPVSLQFDCKSTPHQVSINFGSRPPQMPLGDALKIIANLTQSRTSARVYVGPESLSLYLRWLRLLVYVDHALGRYACPRAA
jgi:hypothetical protein